MVEDGWRPLAANEGMSSIGKRTIEQRWGQKLWQLLPSLYERTKMEKRGKKKKTSLERKITTFQVILPLPPSSSVVSPTSIQCSTTTTSSLLLVFVVILLLLTVVLLPTTMTSPGWRRSPPLDKVWANYDCFWLPCLMLGCLLMYLSSHGFVIKRKRAKEK